MQALLPVPYVCKFLIWLVVRRRLRGHEASNRDASRGVGELARDGWLGAGRPVTCMMVVS
jgi:hypothetical protein